MRGCSSGTAAIRTIPASAPLTACFCSAVAITLNILLAAAKFVVGTLAGSVSITADAMNNLSDVGSGALTLVGFRLSGKSPISSIRSATGGSSM